MGGLMFIENDDSLLHIQFKYLHIREKYRTWVEEQERRFRQEADSSGCVRSREYYTGRADSYADLLKCFEKTDDEQTNK